MNTRLFARAMLAASTALCLPALAMAQDTTQPTPAEASDQAEPPLDDDDIVVVTAERREQSLQDFAGTISVFSGEDLRKIGVQNVTDLQEQVPGLSIANNQGNVEVFIRGIGSSNNTELGDPAAAFHLDGVNLPRPRGIGSAFFDIQRVEVNTGPQGTLRGRNATAGSINAITFRPGLGSFDGSLEFEAGNYEHRSLRGVVNIPVTDNMAVRFSGMYLEHDSYYDNVGPVRGIDVAEAEDNYAGRAQLYWEPTDRLSILIAGDYISENGTGFTGSNFALPLGEIENGNLSSLDEIDNPRDVIARGITPVLDSDHWGIRTKITYDADDFKIEYTGSYRDVDYDYEATTPLTPFFPGVLDSLSFREDALAPANPDGSQPLVDPNIVLAENLDDFSRFRTITDSRSHFHELRIFDTEGDFIWSVGGLYIREDQFSFLASTGDRSPFFSGLEFNTTVDTDSFAFYGDATYEIDGRFRITGGLRYTNDSKQRQGVAARYGFAIGDDNFNCCMGVRVGTEGFEFAARERTIFNPDTDGDGTINNQEIIDFYFDGIKQFGDRDNVDEIFANGPGATDAPCLDTITGDNLTCNGFADTDNFTFAVPFGGQIFRQDGNFDDEFVDWRIRGEWDITPDNLVYALIASGHKSGGFNDNLGDLGVAPTYGTENVILYELGTKNEFSLGNVGVRLNASLFYNDYSDQVFTSLLSVAQAAELGGVEVDLPGGTNQALVVSFSFNAADSRIYGAQLDGGFDLPENIKLDFNLLWLEAEIGNAEPIQDFRFQADVDPENAVFREIEGRRLPRTPRWQFNARLSQAFELPQGELDYVISLGYRSSQYHTIFNSIEFDADGNGTEVTSGRLLDRIDGYWTMDLGIGWSIDDAGKYRLEGFANNVTNAIHEAAIIITQFDNTRFFTRPRTYGARFRAKF
ncbi:TonB-dependent receptor [Alterisphingorhabdus coralli]|uniref:TonB-dependent receptor n=1 Tax=Alterisphingorhabdus coralli TaxID=3071408 RepID=A0AA97I1M5_9SPHN|nr:TonB-dependent receptor [Parasphingorhabdus sp. SCSIO 66989]WOE75528.1 TonB-dependent receptor [Parasphingorhabdus sp. SCSIO 66989]